nr:ASCH domain-containing protein [uncultured Cohaesibacter sp.]
MHDIVDSYAMGDTPELADELLALVLAGKKTAACDSLQLMQQDDIPMPVTGDKYMLLDGRQRPAAVIEITDVFLCRFDEVDEDFARAEGEGDLSYAYWRQGHQDYFTRNGGYSPDMTLVCERFRLLEILDR